MVDKWKTTTKSKNEGEKVIEYSLLASSNQEQVHNHPEKISNLKFLLLNIVWKNSVPYKIKRFGKIETNYQIVAFNIVFIDNSMEIDIDINQVFASKYNLKREKRDTL